MAGTFTCGPEVTVVQPAPDEAEPELEFCLVIEAGVLEVQGLLLCNSIRRFAGRHARARITAVSPRPERRPSTSTIRELETLGVHYAETEIRSPAPEYGPSFKVFALAWAAAQPGPPVLIQLDSDTVFVGEPRLALGGHGAAARPVDVVGMCSTGEDDPKDALWRRMCKVCETEVEALPFIATTIGRQPVRASYNGGLVAASRDLFETIGETFSVLLEADIRPFAESGLTIRTGTELVSAKGAEYWGVSQAAISISLAKLSRTARILPPTHNVPLHMFADLDPLPAPAIHLHYHWLFGTHQESNPVLDGRMALPAVQSAWLKQRLPFSQKSNLGLGLDGGRRC